MNASSKDNRRFGLAGLLCALAASLLLAAVAAAPASAEFGLKSFDLTATNEDSTPVTKGDGVPATQAGSHPEEVTASFLLNSTELEFFVSDTEGDLRDGQLEQMPGLVGDATAMPQCGTADFVAGGSGLGGTQCDASTAIGGGSFYLSDPIFAITSAIYNLEPPPGVVARFGIVVSVIPVIIDVVAKPDGDHNIVTSSYNTSQILTVFGGKLTLWGNPADPAHDAYRGQCLGGLSVFVEPEWESSGTCPSNIIDPRPFLTLPRSCDGPKTTVARIRSWDQPDLWSELQSVTHDDAVPPNPQGFTGCGKLGFAPAVESKATSDEAETGSGLNFDLRFANEGLTSPDGLSESEPKKAEIRLPEGMTINPSIGEGLGFCTPADLARETLDSLPGSGCPNASKLGSLHIELPIVDEAVTGSIFLAQQDDPATATPGAENPFDSLIALYFVLKNTDLGVLVKLPALVEPDPVTGQLVVTLDDIPQFPFSHFTAHLREGQRAPLITPAACGEHTTESRFYPRSDPDSARSVFSSFEITRGVNGSPCPPGGVPPFNPRFEAGSLNNNAGSYSPFMMRLQREDGEQDMTKFSSVLPPGVLGSLAGIEKCGDFAVAVAKSKTGREEQASPSCPANSEIGSTLAGAGVGSALTYVPGKLYLAGPYKGAPLSVVSITPAVAGPFDAGTVAVRLGLDLNPKTAEVEVDGAASDPIPHILKGIVLKLRDLRVHVDRPNFTLNPTSCDESSARATLFGSNLNVFDPADDVPVDLSTRYQAANCQSLGFKPKLGLHLKGGKKRGGHPGLRAVYSPKKGDANVKGLVVRLPRSAFLDQSHIRTICTRVQFAADNCPKAARYGYIRAWTPLLDEPLQGPVWLRSSNHKLPDMVFDLHGLVDVEVATRIDSVRGGIRATVEDAPDAPLSRVILKMQGGKKGLIVNSRNICIKPKRNHANAVGTGQNGKRFTSKPLMQVRCGAKRSHASHVRARVARSSQVG